MEEMEKRRLRYFVGIIMIIFGIMFSCKYTEAASTYKVIYHYSKDSSTKTVTKYVKCGEIHTTLTGTKLKFTGTDKYLFAWIVKRSSDNKWMLKNASSKKYWGSYDNKSLYYYEPGEKLQKVTKKNEEIHLYGYWVNLNKIDVTKPVFGADGEDKKTDTKAFQKALNIANNVEQTIKVVVPAGTYYMSNTLKVYSNTTLNISENTTIRRIKEFKKGCMVQIGYGIKVANKKGGYTQAKNIIINGGRWLNDPSGSYANAAVMRFHHCYNISLKNALFENYSAKHALVYVAAKKVLIDSCVFRDQKLKKGSEFYELVKEKPKSKKNGEAIHTDFAGEIDCALPYDGTICDEVRIMNCSFSDIFSGIGSHIETTVRGTSYMICNNYFRNVSCNCLSMYSRDKIEIYSNSMINCGRFLVNKNSSYEVLQYPVNEKGTVSSIIKGEN